MPLPSCICVAGRPPFDRLNDIFCALSQINLQCVAPVLVSASINDDQLTLVFSENVTGHLGFTLEIDGGNAPLTYVSGEGSNTLLFTSNPPANEGEEVILNYDEITGNVTSEAECPLAAIEGFSVTNETTGPPNSADLIEWWDNRDADLSVTGSLVDTWTGRENGLVLTGTTTTRPTKVAVSGVNYLNFAGDYLQLPAGFTWNKQNHSLFIVMRRASLGTGTNGLWQMETTGQVDAILLGGQLFRTWNAASGPNDTATPINFADNIATAFMIGNASNTTIGLNNQSGTVAANSSGTANGSGYLGAWSAAGFPLDTSDVLAVVAYSRALDATERAAVLDWATTRYNATSRTYGKYLLFDGDSLTAGVQSTNVRNWSYPAQLSRLVTSGQPKYGNIGVGGQQIQNVTAATAAKLQLSYNTTLTGTLVFWMGSNDINNARTGAQVWGDIQTYLSTVRASYPSVKIVGCTILTRSDNTGSEETNRTTLNTSILTTSSGSGGFDYTVDLAADSRLSNASDTTYFDPDGVHLNDTGYGVVTALVKAVLDANALV